jgi:hypothetical protein
MHTTPLQPQSNSTVECYIKIVKEHLRQEVSTHQRDWDNGPKSIHPLDHMHDTHQHGVLEGAPSVLQPTVWGIPKQESKINHMMDLMERLNNIHHSDKQHLRMASDRIQAHYDHLAKEDRFPGDLDSFHC